MTCDSFHGRCKKEAAPGATNTGDGKADTVPNVSASRIPKILGGFKMNDKNFYIQAISDLMERCNDLSLLDLIYKILIKAVNV